MIVTWSPDDTLGNVIMEVPVCPPEIAITAEYDALQEAGVIKTYQAFCFPMTFQIPEKVDT